MTKKNNFYSLLLTFTCIFTLFGCNAKTTAVKKLKVTPIKVKSFPASQFDNKVSFINNKLFIWKDESKMTAEDVRKVVQIGKKMDKIADEGLSLKKERALLSEKLTELQENLGPGERERIERYSAIKEEDIPRLHRKIDLQRRFLEREQAKSSPNPDKIKRYQGKITKYQDSLIALNSERESIESSRGLNDIFTILKRQGTIANRFEELSPIGIKLSKDLGINVTRFWKPSEMTFEIDQNNEVYSVNIYGMTDDCQDMNQLEKECTLDSGLIKNATYSSMGGTLKFNVFKVHEDGTQDVLKFKVSRRKYNDSFNRIMYQGTIELHQADGTIRYGVAKLSDTEE